MDQLPSRHLSLAGIPIDAITREDLLRILDSAKNERSKLLILNHNLHSLYLYLTVPDFRALYSQAKWIYIDGMPVVWFGKLAGLSLLSEHRITFLDCFDAILMHAQSHGWKIFYLGSSAEVLSEGLAVLRARYPKLVITGRNGYISDPGAENDEVISQINDFKADVLFVGMGMPLQERWLAKNLSRVEASSVLTSGATMDYITGHTYKPPAWAGPLGLYGVFRLFHDPHRLWKRYLLEPIYLVRRLSLPILRQRFNGLKPQVTRK
jgi:N-acetylglucosaminyldiphosphoundecaprenol N-acetyl-beta-D-mannosaminyltransferase